MKISHSVLAVLVAVALNAPFQGDTQVAEYTLKSFGYDNGTNDPIDGLYPEARLVQGSDGALYGTTSQGGANNMGTVFKVNTNGIGYALLYNLHAMPGSAGRYALVQGSDGALYGTTIGGGSNGVGTIFRLNTDGTGYAVLYDFLTNGVDGETPGTGLTLGKDGMLYGTTQGGGRAAAGTVFKLRTDGTEYEQLYYFRYQGSFDGQNPCCALVQGSDGALYGTTYGGGWNGLGTVYTLSTNGWNCTVLYNLSAPSGGGWDNNTWLMQGADGALYGVSTTGGTTGRGCVFKLNTDGSDYTLLHSLWAGTTDPEFPMGGIVQGLDGALYGTTYFGGNTMLGGTVYRLDTNGADYTVFYSFTGNPANPLAPLIQGTDGAFYGTTQYGGVANRGAVFRLELEVFPPQLACVGASTNQILQITLTGIANTTYRIDASFDLSNWMTISNVWDETGTVQFTDPETANFSHRFYRAVWVP